MLAKIKPGFGLIEALIASGIIVMVAGASVSLSTLISRKTQDFNNKIVANHLASEALEVAHWIRDHRLNDGKSETDWNSGFIKTVDPNSGELTGTSLSCPITPGPYNPDADSCKFIITNNVYNNSTKFGLVSRETDDVITLNTESFVRKIYLDTAKDNEVQVQVIISKLSEPTKEITNIATVLTNWKEAK